VAKLYEKHYERKLGAKDRNNEDKVLSPEREQ
jgi:hypothetical protein